MHRLANCLASCEYVNLTASVRVREKKLATFQDRVAAPVEAGGTEASILELIQLCKDGCFLQAELPQGSIEQSLQLLFGRVIQEIDAFLSGGSSSSSAVQSVTLQKLMAECCITFPFKKELEEYKLDLAKLFSQTLAEEKKQALLRTFNDVVQALESEGWQDVLPKLWVAAGEADGVTLSEDEKAGLQKSMAGCDDLLLKLAKEDPKAGTQLTSAFQKVSTSVGINREVFELVQNVVSLAIALLVIVLTVRRMRRSWASKKAETAWPRSSGGNMQLWSLRRMRSHGARTISRS